jgi:hypothetical protein
VNKETIMAIGRAGKNLAENIIGAGISMVKREFTERGGPSLEDRQIGKIAMIGGDIAYDQDLHANVASRLSALALDRAVVIGSFEVVGVRAFIPSALAGVEAVQSAELLAATIEKYNPHVVLQEEPALLGDDSKGAIESSYSMLSGSIEELHGNHGLFVAVTDPQIAQHYFGRVREPMLRSGGVATLEGIREKLEDNIWIPRV